jgi:hypothetical protein
MPRCGPKIMPLKFKYAKKDEVPAEHAGLYVERDGALVLDVDGAVAKERLDEFRANNIELQNRLKGWEGIDAAKARELLMKEEELREGELLKKGDVAALIESKLSPFRTDLERERTRNKELQGQIDGAKLSDAVRAAGAKAGVRSPALMDLQARASRAFKVVDGEVVSAGNEKNLDEWVEALKAEAPHLFEQNSGGGAAGNGSGGAGLNHGQRNPWKKETLNLTEQSKLTRDNPRLAAQLRAAAGR